jgi:hypothetical protein
MTQKSKFLKSAKLAITGLVLGSSLTACGMMSEKHNCAFKGKEKSEKSDCSAKHGCSTTKDEKAVSPVAKDEKAKCSSKHSCSAKKAKAKCSSAKKAK